MSGLARLDAGLRVELPRLAWADVIALVPAEGELLELGVYHGESFREICACAAPRKVWGFDWWRGLPEGWSTPEEKGLLNMDGVPPACPENGEFVVGLVRGTLPGFVAEHGAAAFVHFDMDLYSSTAEALYWLRFVLGAILAFDEIVGCNRNIDGEQRALRQWLERTGAGIEVIGQRHPQSLVLRVV